MYWFHAVGEGYHELFKNLESNDDDPLIVDANPGKMKGAGYEPRCMHQFSEAVYKKMYPLKEEWKTKYPEAYSTPTISSKTKAEHEFTSQEEMEAYIDALPKTFTKFSIGRTQSEFHLDMPLLVFTKSDIKGAADLNAVAEILKKDDRMTVVYLAQIHGTEPAGGDNALAICKALSEGRDDTIPDRMNILIVPRVNPDGARMCTRKNVADQIDLNRDYIRVKSYEVTAVEKLCHLFRPEVVIDGHEYNFNAHRKVAYKKDVLLGIGGGVNTDETLVGCTTKVTNEVIKELNKEGLCATYYAAPEYCGAVRGYSMVDTANWATGRGYFSLIGSVSILVETMGYQFGKKTYERRLVSQFVTIWNLLKQFAENCDEVRAAVEKERESLSVGGSKFSEENRFCLYSGSTFEKHETMWSPKYDYATGEFATDPDFTIDCPYYDKAERDRARATAFVLSKDVPHLSDVMEIIGKHEIHYEELPCGAELPLKQYHGEVVHEEDTLNYKVPEATLTEETTVRFEHGAYFFPCNQPSALLMMYLFEPDINDTECFGSSFTQSGML